MSGFYGYNVEAELMSVRSWDPRSGYSIRRQWRGTPAAIDLVEEGLVLAGIPYTREVEGHGYNLITAIYGAPVTQPQGEPLSDLWSLQGNDLEKSIWESPVARTLFADFLTDGFVTAQYVSVRRDIEDLVSGAKLLTDITWWDTASDLMKQFVTDLLGGTQTFFISSWVLRRTTVVAKGSSIKPTVLNVNKVYTSTLLLRQWEGVPADEALPFNVPDGMWLKKTPTFDAVAGDKWQITQEYWHADSHAKSAYAGITQGPS